MNPLRRYIDIIESSEDRIVYHGGTYAGGEYNPAAKGEPGNLRPLGLGIYAAKTRDHAERYLKYVAGSTVKKFKISNDAELYPWGGGAWNSASPAEQEKWREKSKAVQRAFEEAGLVKKSRFGDRYQYWNDSILNNPTEEKRKLLVSLGVDGSYSHLASGLVEYVFYNTNVLELVKE